MDKKDEDMKLDRALAAFAVGEPSADLVERIVAQTFPAAQAENIVPFRAKAGWTIPRPVIAKMAMAASLLIVIGAVVLQFQAHKGDSPDMSVERFVNDVVASADMTGQNGDDPLALLETVQQDVAQERQIEQFLDQVVEDDDNPNDLF